MPKKRKTRKQKIITDQKRQVVPEMTLPVASAPLQSIQQEKHQPVTTGTFKLPAVPQNKPHNPKQTITISLGEYGYLPTDLLRTAVLSGAIVITELLIRFIFVH